MNSWRTFSCWFSVALRAFTKLSVHPYWVLSCWRSLPESISLIYFVVFPFTDWLCSAWVTDDQGDSGSRPSLVACTSTPQPFCSASTFFVRPKNDLSWGLFHCFSKKLFEALLTPEDIQDECTAECGLQNCVCSQNYCITKKNNSILTSLSSAFTCVSNLILKTLAALLTSSLSLSSCCRLPQTSKLEVI